MTFRDATEADAGAWQALLGRCSFGDFLHDWAWAAVAEFDGQPQRRFVVEDGGEIVAVAAAQRRSLPFGHTFWYVPHGPVLDYGRADVSHLVRQLTTGLREAAAAERAVAVRLEPRLEAHAPEVAAFVPSRLRRSPTWLQVGHTRLVTLADDETLMSGFDKDTRYAVRRAEREGVEIGVCDDATDARPVDELHALVAETQRRAGFPLPPLDRYRIAWRALGGAGRAVILEARRGSELLASGLLVVEGQRSFYLFSGSRREAPGEPKHYASYALQWAMMRMARDRGAAVHDLWGIAPPNAAPDHPWHGVGLFKRGFGGREAHWAGSWDIVVDANLYRLREAAAMLRGWARAARASAQGLRR